MAACAACGDPHAQERVREGYYGVVSCARCGLMSIEPGDGAVDLSVEQSEEEYVASYSGTLDRVVERRLAMLRSVLPQPAKVLDFGAGFGYIAKRLQAAGYEVTALEISPNALASIRRHGIRAVAGLDELEGQRFDVVTMWHVLEHVERPAPLLARLADYLFPGGTAIVAVPNARGLFASLSLDHWIWTLPWHHHYFDRRSLWRLLARSGFDVVSTTTDAGDIAALECLIGESVLGRPSRLRIWDLSQRQAPARAPLRTLAAGILRPISWAMQRAASRLNAGEELIVRSVKRDATR